MRALSLTARHTATIVEIPDPLPGRGDVLVHIDACGVCGSDLNAWHGVPGVEFPLPPGGPGHEAVGVVAALGPGVDSLSVGDRVTGLMWNGFAERGVARAVDLVRLTPRSTVDVLGEPLACAMNVVRRSNLQLSHRVAVVGFGYLASLTVQLFPPGLTDWVAISRRADSRALAASLGAATTCDFDTVPSDAWDSFDVVIEAAGVQRSLDYATWLTAYGGRMIIAGYHADGPRSVDLQTWNWKGIDVINAHERRREVSVDALRAALRHAAGRPLEVASLHTHHIPLVDAAEGFRLAAERPPGFVKAVIHP